MGSRFIDSCAASIALATLALVFGFISAPNTVGSDTAYTSGYAIKALLLLIAGAGASFGLIGYRSAATVREARIALACLLACAGSPVGFYIGLLFSPYTTIRSWKNESNALHDTRTVVSAESTYKSATGYYGTITCLATPAGCIANYPANAPIFLDASLGQPTVTWGGYRRQWFETPSTSAPMPGAIDKFCYSATPAVPSKTGTRSFGGDSSGNVRSTTPTEPLTIQILLQDWLGTVSPTVACCNKAVLDTAACPMLIQ
jgi:hypothetical protein